MEYKPLTDKENSLAKEVVDIAYKIHKEMGSGLLESVYEKCFCYELEKRNIAFQRQAKVDIFYDGHLLDDGLRLDILVEDVLILELKANKTFEPIWQAQLLSYLKLTNVRIGFIINFHNELIKDGIKRMIN